MEKADTSDVSIEALGTGVTENSRPVSARESNGQRVPAAADLVSAESRALASDSGNDSNSDTHSNVLRELLAPIDAEMAQVDGLLKSVFSHQDPYIDRLLGHGSVLSGKRMRPALLLLSAKACGDVVPAHFVLAAAIEMIHTASLVHDDLLDEAEQRRHVETVHRRWNNESAVLFGDFLFTKAFLMVGRDVGGDACGRLAQATNRVCEGELKQISHRGDFALSVDRYFEIINDKTAALCEIATYFGAAFSQPEISLDAEARERTAAFAEYGKLLGQSFQIVDDILDVAGHEEQVGKSLGRDIELAKATLPLLLSLEQCPGPERNDIVQAMNNGTMGPKQIQQWVARHGGIDAAREVAMQLSNRAQEAISKWSEDNQAARALRKLAQFVIARQH